MPRAIPEFPDRDRRRDVSLLVPATRGRSWHTDRHRRPGDHVDDRLSLCTTNIANQARCAPNHSASGARRSDIDTTERPPPPSSQSPRRACSDRHLLLDGEPRVIRKGTPPAERATRVDLDNRFGLADRVGRLARRTMRCVEPVAADRRSSHCQRQHRTGEQHRQNCQKPPCHTGLFQLRVVHSQQVRVSGTIKCRFETIIVKLCNNVGRQVNPFRRLQYLRHGPLAGLHGAYSRAANFERTQQSNFIRRPFGASHWRRFFIGTAFYSQARSRSPGHRISPSVYSREDFALHGVPTAVADRRPCCLAFRLCRYRCPLWVADEQLVPRAGQALRRHKSLRDTGSVRGVAACPRRRVVDVSA